MKRFTETLKWCDPWYRKLTPENKNLWEWLVDNCDNAGVIDLDLELASFHIGYQYPMLTLSDVFGDRVRLLDCGKWLVVKFIAFQYGELSHDCKAHNPVFASLEKHKVNGYPKGIDTLQEKDKVKVKDKDKEKDKDMRFKKPTLAEVKFCAEKSGLPPNEAERFYSYYESNGWKVGRNPMRSWPHAVANWKKNYEERRYSSKHSKPTHHLTDATYDASENT
jgi:hypothetical protein